MEKILEVNRLVKKYSGFTLQDITFSIGKGEVLGLIGDNGAGKTTLIKILTGFINQDSGYIKIFDCDSKKLDKNMKYKLSYVPDSDYIPEHLTPFYVGKIMGSFYKEKWENEKYLMYLKLFNISYKKKIGTFSKGMKAKLSIILALVHNAELLIMDEPFEGLDPTSRKRLLEKISAETKDNNTSIIISSHIISDLEKVVSRVIMLEKGNIKHMLDRRNLKKYIMDNKGLEKLFDGNETYDKTTI